MKKWIALLMTLCLLAAAVPALGEDYSGNWYMTIADVSMGVLALNADGTASMTMMEQEGSTGTWTPGEGKVTVTIDGDAVDFIYADGMLTADVFPVPFSRNEGKLSMTVMTQLINGDSSGLPEGMTEDDARAIAMNFITEYQKLTEDSSNAGTTTETAPETTTETVPETTAEPVTEEAAPEVTKLNENFAVMTIYGGLKGYYYAKIQNNTDKPYFVNGGSFVLTDADGNEVGDAQKYPNSRGSRYLEPGEVSFISFRVDIPEGVENPGYKVEIKAETDSYASKDYAVEVTGTEIGTDRYGNPTMKVAVTNTSDAFLPGINAIIALEDAEGNVIWLREENLYNYELGPNSTIKLTGSIDSDAMEYFTANGIVPTTVEAYAYVETDD